MFKPGPMEFEAPDSHHSVPINSQPTQILLKWCPLALLNPSNNCLLLQQHDGEPPLMGTRNELLYTHAVIVRRTIIFHVYIACFHLSESQGTLHIISLIIKQRNTLIKAFFFFKYIHYIIDYRSMQKCKQSS